MAECEVHATSVPVKTCKHCAQEKPTTEFYLRHGTGRPRAECKACYLAARTATRDPADNRRRVRGIKSSASSALARFSMCFLTAYLFFARPHARMAGVQRDTVSIDRIDQTAGYVVGNIRLLTYQANFARNRFSDEELFEFCRAVLDWRANKSP